MQEHIEGGYFVETDRDPLRVPNPFISDSQQTKTEEAADDAWRNASTTIYYLLTLTAKNSFGRFHRNKGRTVHTLHWGRGRYVLIHADRPDGKGKFRIESFVVGKDIEKGEKLQWIVEGGKYKASFLLPDEDSGRGESEGGLLISETVVPGFDYKDHDFLREEGFEKLVTESERRELEWMLRRV